MWSYERRGEKEEPTEKSLSLGLLAYRSSWEKWNDGRYRSVLWPLSHFWSNEQEKGAAVDHDTMIAKLPEGLVKDALETAPKEFNLCARDPKLCREVRGVFIRAVQSFYARRARDEGVPLGRCGAVVYTQRFDSALRLDVHFHALVLDGVYTGFGVGEPLVFHEASRLQDEEIESLVQHIAALLGGHLHRRGVLDEEGQLDPGAGEDLDTLGTCHAASIQGLIPFGEKRGQRMTLWGEADEIPRPPPRSKKKLCADHHGYSLHAGVRVAACSSRRERLARYVARGPIAKDRLSVNRQGDIVYRFRRRWRNGKQAVVMDPMTFLSRLAALIPPPRSHVLSYHGVLGAAAARRDEIVPEPPPPESERVPHPCQAGKPKRARSARKRQRRARIPWATLLERVYLIDVLRCDCGGRRRVLAMVRDPSSIERVLTHLGLPTGFPPRGPPRAVAGSLPLAHAR